MIIIIIIIILAKFLHHLWRMILHWSLSNSKSPQLFRTLLSILADLSSGMDSLNYFSIFQCNQFLFWSFQYCTEGSHKYWYYCHLHVQWFFQLFGKVEFFAFP